MTSIETLLATHPELRPALTLFRALITGLVEVKVSLPTGVPDAEAARIRVEAGIPGLEGEPLLDGAALLDAARVIVQRLADAGSADATTRILPLLERALSATDDVAIVRWALAGAWEDIAAAAASGALGHREVDEQMLITLLDYATRPALRAAAAVIRDEIANARWTRGTCPACGAPPLLAELRAQSSGGERERTLRCGRCATAWTFPRVGCPACGTTDHHALGYLHVDGEEEFRRAATCERCTGYLKEVAVLDGLEPNALLEEDLATVGLDLIAVERGYRRGISGQAG